MKALVVFDLDGTLVDSERDLAESTNEMLASYGAPALPIERVAGMVGEGARVLVERALKASGLAPGGAPINDALDRFRAIYDRRLLIHTRPYPGIPEVVREAAARASVALLTNKPEAPARRLLDAFGLLPSFRWLIGGDGAFPRKPDPSGLTYLMAQAGAGPADTLLVGDSLIDVQTAERAGVRLCVASYGFARLDGAAAGAGALVAATPAGVGEAIAQVLARTAAG